MDRSEIAHVSLGDGIPYAPPSSPIPIRRLGDVGARIKKALENAAFGPLIAAGDVRAISEDWDRYEHEADGLSCNAWLVKYLGPSFTLQFFERRQRAVEILGEDIRRFLHHEAAVWVSQAVPEAQIAEVKTALEKRYRNPSFRTAIVLSQAQKIVREIIGRSNVRTKTCSRCQLLERALAENGITIPKR